MWRRVTCVCVDWQAGHTDLLCTPFCTWLQNTCSLTLITAVLLVSHLFWLLTVWIAIRTSRIFWQHVFYNNTEAWWTSKLRIVQVAMAYTSIIACSLHKKLFLAFLNTFRSTGLFPKVLFHSVALLYCTLLLLMRMQNAIRIPERNTQISYSLSASSFVKLFAGARNTLQTQV